ncbi:hypothetical protein AB0958_22500 [Streptomyces sp. NPDC006655]|uniref:hypothetical protein n=1 Tax=Streptomyces sp. NPDC006655 TaxID=3156898 RepID=UPI0034518302
MANRWSGSRLRAIERSRIIVEDALDDVADLPDMDPAQRQFLRTQVLRTVSRTRAARIYRTTLWSPVYWTIVLAFTSGFGIATYAWMRRESREVNPSGIGFGVALGFLSLFLMSVRLRRLETRYQSAFLQKAYYYSSYMIYPLSGISYSATKASWAPYVAGAAVVPMSMFATGLLVVVQIGISVRRRAVRTDTIYAAASYAMLQSAALAYRSRGGWYLGAVSRRVTASLEDLARICQDNLTLRKRFGVAHPEVFSQTALEALRVAHLVRQHKIIIVCASGPGDFERVAVSLRDGLQALLANDRSKLLENAPDAVRKERVKVIMRHFLPVLLFIAAAIILPIVPPVSDQGKIADSIRITFIVAAVLALVAPNSDSSSRILEVLGKAMPSK